MIIRLAFSGHTSSMTKYATANCSICSVDRTSCCNRLGLKLTLGAGHAVACAVGVLLSESVSLGPLVDVGGFAAWCCRMM